ncbi:putative tetratricopeptide-like helical domain-containing protein [Tanacetum coccineum]|uniref:Tetratricopeptide-like helical domain-containing protein n=1 Tax=Tanacetum coccineum TaxID=301880 RepID=A0ABQ5G2Y4_9ASTR
MTCSRRNLRLLISHRHSPRDYPTTSTIFLAHKLDDALQLFDEMLHRNPPPCIIEFNKLITPIVKMKHYTTSLNLYKKISLVGIPQDLYAMNISINCYSRLKQVNYSFALLATIFKLGHPPDSATYATLINGLVLADRVFEAVELFKKLIRNLQ